MDELQKLQRRCHELEAITGLVGELLQLDDYDAMLDAVVRRCLSVFAAERGFVVLKRGGSLDFKVVRNWSREELEGGGEAVSRTILKEVLRHGAPLVVEDATSDPRFGDRQSVRILGVRSVLAAPLQVEGEVVGALYLETGSIENLFGAEELGLFEQILRLCSRVLETSLRRILLEQRSALLEKDLLARYNFQGIFTRDPKLLQVLETVGKTASSDLPVLLQGPSGTGKELLARAVYLNSRRARAPFVTVNCGAISPQLLESELFGHVRGAFTGATGDKQGLIPSAHGGTLFLDEVSELPKDLQVKLLRTLQFGEVLPVGSARPQIVDVRFVAATNRDLEREVREGRFREDLYYRLNSITLLVPALSERPDDVLPLFYHFLRKAAEKAGQAAPEVRPELERALQQYGWPGNVRELENEAYRLLAIHTPGLPLTPERLSPRIAQSLELGRPAGRASSLPSLEEQERQLIELHLKQANGNRVQTARSLGIGRETLRRKMRQYGLA